MFSSRFMGGGVAGAGVSHLKATGGMQSRPVGAYNWVFNFGPSQTQGGGVQSF